MRRVRPSRLYLPGDASENEQEHAVRPVGVVGRRQAPTPASDRDARVGRLGARPERAPHGPN